jgi:alkanesulfonate monooxygenase SsuD/methylene tetrahydromethanopterin reductase-like flavin-dependent oxidoreductase (luciferase family)
MPQPGTPLAKLGFLTIGLFDSDDPGPGHRSTLEVIELGERLGFDSAWLRHRHLQYGISSPVAVMAAASQRTSRIELGTAVTPLGWENPLRLAEDLATVDILSGGRINPGVSVGPPRDYDDVKQALYPDASDREDFSYQRVARLLSHIAGEPAASFKGTAGFEEYSNQVQPHSPGLRQRMWYGGASLSSARWAGEHAMNFLTSSVIRAEETEDFAEAQRLNIAAFRAALCGHAGFREVTEVAFALPFTFEHADYVQILTDVAGKLGPALGWTPVSPGGNTKALPQIT